MKRILVIGLLMLSSLLTMAGDGKYEILFKLNPSMEWVYFRNNYTGVDFNSIWGTKLSYNGGLEYIRFLDPSLSFTIGVDYMNKGFRNKVPYLNSANQNDYGITRGDMHIVSIPLYVNIHQRIKRKVELVYTGGISAGWLFSERVRNKYYTAEDIPENSLLSNIGESNVNLFNNYFVSLDLGVGISAFVKSRVVLTMQPMLKVQVHDAVDPYGQLYNGDLFSMHMCSFGMNLKAGWFFSKQIRNRRKDA